MNPFSTSSPKQTRPLRFNPSTMSFLLLFQLGLRSVFHKESGQAASLNILLFIQSLSPFHFLWALRSRNTGSYFLQYSKFSSPIFGRACTKLCFGIRYSAFFFLLLFLLLFSCPLSAQEWTEPLNITNLGGYSIDPDMVIDHKGIIHVVWSYKIEDWYWKIMYCKSEDDGETWTEPLDLLQNTDLWMSQPHIDCDSKNHLYVTYDYATGTQYKMVYMIVYDGHQWSEPIIVSEGMPGSDYNKVVVDNDYRVFVFWAYGSQFMYYRYRENEAWSDFYCPYCDSANVFAFADGHYISDNLMHWIGSSYSFNYYGERPQYYEFNMTTNTWKNPEMICSDTVLVDIDIALSSNDEPVCVYRNHPSGDDRTKLIRKEGNYWSDPVLVAGTSGSQQYQQIAVDQNNDVHIVEQQKTVEGYGLVHYKKKDDNWLGQFIDSCYIINFPKLLFSTNNLYLVYSKTWVVGKEFVGDLFFTRYDIITDVNEEPIQPPELKIYPNPAHNDIYIEFENNKEQHIDLSIFDINGKHIITLISETKPQGLYRQLWNGTDKNGKEVNSGSYFVRLKLGRNTFTRTVEVLK